MPYIDPERRKLIDPDLKKLCDKISGAGMLNYAITMLCLHSHLHTDGYQRIAETVGVLETAKLEFYRRRASTYEDRKWAEHGDVYF